MFGGLKLRLVDDYRKAWRFSSIRCLAVAGSCQAAVVASDRLGYSQHIPGWVLSTLSTFALLGTIAAGVGRITTTDPKEQSDDDRHEHL